MLVTNSYRNALTYKYDSRLGNTRSLVWKRVILLKVLAAVPRSDKIDLFIYSFDKPMILCSTQSFNLYRRYLNVYRSYDSRFLPFFLSPVSPASDIFNFVQEKLFMWQTFWRISATWLQVISRWFDEMAKFRVWEATRKHTLARRVESPWKTKLWKSNWAEFVVDRRTGVNVCCIVDVSGQLLMTRRSRLSNICDPDGEMIRKLKYT